ncbi:hypothetical protein [Devosia lucknowensis]|nr:hypothetical protein [Devosia lucknowensis]
MTTDQSNTGARRIRDISLFVIVFLFFAFVFLQFMLTNSSSDLHLHIRYAEEIKSFSDIHSPHFLFQITINFIHFITGLSHSLSTATLLGICYGAMAILIAHRILRTGMCLDASMVYGSTFLVLVASHIFAVTILVPNFYYNYLVPITYHNPTQQLNKVFAVAIWFIYCDLALSKENNWSPAKLALLSGLCVVSAVAKPSFLIAFLPISGVIALFDLWRRQWRRAFNYALAMIPVTLVLVWQFGSHYGASEKGGIIFAPFVVFPNPVQYLLMIPMSLAFPIVVTICFWREAKHSRALQMAWSFMLLALFYTLFLAESQDIGSGNFAWTAQTGAFLLYIESLLLVMERRAATGRFKTIPIAVLGVHVACGFVFAGASAFWPAPLWQ